MLIGNYSVNNKNTGRHYSSTSGAGTIYAAARSNWNTPSDWDKFPMQDASGDTTGAPTVWAFSSKPTGYYPPGSWGLAVTEGAISSYRQLNGAGALTNANMGALINGIASVSGAGAVTSSNMNATGNMTGPLTGSGAVVAADSALGNITAPLTGSGSLGSPSITGKGNIGSGLTGSGDFTSTTIKGVGFITGTVTGLGTLTGSINAFAAGTSALTGSGSIVGSVSATMAATAALTGAGAITAAMIGALNGVAALSGGGAVSAAIAGAINMVGALTGAGAMTNADMRLTAGMIAQITGSGGVTGAAGAAAGMVAHLGGTGEVLTTFNAAQAVWDALLSSFNNAGTFGAAINSVGAGANPWTAVIENGLTAEQILRIIVGVLAGKSSGGGTTNIHFRDLADAKNRVAAVVDTSGNRSSVTVDPT